jgi:hypothetical protein
MKNFHQNVLKCNLQAFQLYLCIPYLATVCT